ncbi:MAG: nucleoside-diphosphate kinase [Deltaproteobacteria bacterium]|nr:nucleoside-diphosphate kinase [Deltaproteobacteria bacterium]
MATERTLALVKPDAVAKNAAGEILAMIQKAGLKVRALKMLRLSQAQARGFYAVHRERPFYDSLVAFMTEGPIIAAVLEGEGAVARYRDLMGATNPANAGPGTIRKLFAQNIERNAVHGSDAVETARTEIAYVFSELEIEP